MDNESNPTLRDRLQYVKQYERSIFVREQIDGKWRNVAISELSPERWAYYVANWVEAGITPHRVVEQPEPEKTDDCPSCIECCWPVCPSRL